MHAKDYSLRCIDNVYITGARFRPHGASWDPMMTMVALAMDLVDHLTLKVRVTSHVEGFDIKEIISAIDSIENAYLYQ